MAKQLPGLAGVRYPHGCIGDYQGIFAIAADKMVILQAHSWDDVHKLNFFQTDTSKRQGIRPKEPL